MVLARVRNMCAIVLAKVKFATGHLAVTRAGHHPGVVVVLLPHLHQVQPLLVSQGLVGQLLRGWSNSFSSPGGSSA